MSTERLVQWEVWKDPYGENLDEFEWPGAFDNPDEDKEDKPDFMKTPEEIYMEGEPSKAWKPKPMERKPIKIIQTPMGMVPMVEYTMPSKIFNFRLCHTNFNITRSESNIIKKAIGVEILEIQSRYRFRIGIGRIFKVSEVIDTVTKALNATIIRPQKDETKNPQ